MTSKTDTFTSVVRLQPGKASTDHGTVTDAKGKTRDVTIERLLTKKNRAVKLDQNVHIGKPRG